MGKYIKKPKKLYLHKGYKPSLTKAWREPSSAEPIVIKNIRKFADLVDFKKINFDWGRGTRGPKSSNVNSLLAVWIYGYIKGITFGTKLSTELKRNKDLQYLSRGCLFSFAVLNKFRRALGDSLPMLLEELLKWNGEPQGDIYVDGTLIEGASSKHEFRQVKSMERLKKNTNNKLKMEIVNHCQE